MHVRPYTLFLTLHPALLFLYAFGAPVLAMLSRSPECLLITFSCSCVVHTFYYGRSATWDGVKCLLPFLLVIACFNLFSGAGGLTVLFWIGHRAFKLESLCYGLASGVMMGAVLMWFRCFTALLPNDKFLYLFGRRLPGAALLLSMILKLFPETRYKIWCIRMAEASQDFRGKKTWRQRLSKSLRQLSCLLEWSMEDCIETADSMKARAYGSAKRTSYEKYPFTYFDSVMLFILTVLFILSAGAAVAGDRAFVYYPVLKWQAEYFTERIVMEICYALFLLLPLLMEGLRIGGKRR